MGVDDLENKDEKLFKDLSRGINNTVKIMNSGMDVADKLKAEIIASTTPKEIARQKAFTLKYVNLMSEGKVAEAQELKDKYTNE